MDGSRGYFSAAAGSTPATEAHAENSVSESTSTRPASTGSRLRQKPVSAAPNENFFASLGITNASRGNSASSVSKNYSQTTKHYVSNTASRSSTSSWTPPPIGGLGSQRSIPPSIGSLGIPGSRTTSTTKSTTNSMTTDPSSKDTNQTKSATVEPILLAASSSTNLAARSKPTQLFSMDDAEDLYSDDGWDCDSPSTVLSGSMDDATASVTTGTPMAAAAAQVQKEEFSWGDDDDLFASPVATPMAPHAHLPLCTTSSSAGEVNDPNKLISPLHVRDVAESLSVASGNFEVEKESGKAQVTSLPPAAVPSTPPTYGTKSATSQLLSPIETRSVLEHTPTAKTAFAAMQSSFLAHKPTEQSAFKTRSDRRSEAMTCTESHQQDEDWHHQEKVVENLSEEGKVNEAASSGLIMSDTATMTVQTDALMAPPVELTSPAGDFWNEEDALFDHDDHAKDDWNETVEDSSYRTFAAESHGNTAYPDFSSHDNSFALPTKQEVTKSAAVFDHSGSQYQEKKEIGRQDDVTGQDTIAMSPSQTHQQSAQLHYSERKPELKPATYMDTGSPPFSTTRTKSQKQISVTEVPRAARFLHTPTGTGGAFGRVPSPHGNDTFDFRGDSSGAALSTEHEEKSTQHDTMTSTDGSEDDSRLGSRESYTHSSVKWNDRSTQSYEQNQAPFEEQANSRCIGSRLYTRQGQSDEEERDSVVSFSGENSFFPSAGRPSSLYGGSQSSFASHRMNQSSVASTDHDGSSIASFGVSSAGATFGGSEHISESGAYSDGSISETPSMVNSSNASTAFGTDFPSASEGQFSAPGTTIGGSDNASDEEFSDDNASETTSINENMSANLRSASEYGASSMQYNSETIASRDAQEPFAESAPNTNLVTKFEESKSAALSSVYGSPDNSNDEKPCASSSGLFSTSQQAVSGPVAASSIPSGVTHQLGGITQEEIFPSAASLFGATTGADIPNPFSAFSASANITKPSDAPELPTLNVENLVTAGSSTSFFESPHATSVKHSHSSGHQVLNQHINQGGRDTISGTHASNISSFHSQFGSSSPFDHSKAEAHVPSAFGYNDSSTDNKANFFATHSNTQYDFENSIQSANISSLGSGDHLGIDRKAKPHLNGAAQTSADAVIGGYRPSDNSDSIAANSFKQSLSIPSTSLVGGHNQSLCSTLTLPPNQSSSGDFKTSGEDRHGQFAGNAFNGRSYEQKKGVEQSIGSNFSHQSSTSSITSNKVWREHSDFGSRSSSNYQRPISGPSIISNHAADVHGHSRLSEQPLGGNQNHIYTPEATTQTRDDSRTLSGAAADAFFERLSTTNKLDALSKTIERGEESIPAAPANLVFQQPTQTHAQQTFLVAANDKRQFEVETSEGFYAQPRNSYSSPSSVDNVSVSHHVSSGSFHETNTSVGSWNNGQQHINTTPVHTSFNATSYFSEALSANTQVTASSFFGGTTSQDSSAMQMMQRNNSSASNAFDGQAAHGQSQRMVNQEQPYVKADLSRFDLNEKNARAPETAPIAQVNKPPSTAYVNPPMPGDTRQRDSDSVSEITPSSAAISDKNLHNSTMRRDENMRITKRPQSIDGFAGFSSQGSSEQRLPTDFFSNLPAQTHNATSSHQFAQPAYYQQQGQERAQDFTVASPPNNGGALYGGSGVHEPAASPRSLYNIGDHGADITRTANHLHYQMPEQQYHQQQPYSATGFEDRAGGVKQIQNHLADKHAFGAGLGYHAANTSQASHIVAAPFEMTANKHKDPCVAPPSCLASFGFGGNVVTMFPDRKFRPNISGSSFRNNPRGTLPRSEFENGGNSELCKGPVNFYRMDQLHSKDKEYSQMDTFPGPLTGNVSEDVIREYIDDRLKRSEAPTSAIDAEDEDDRLLLGVLRIIIKCNGKLRSDPGTMKPNDPESPEAQLIILFDKSSKRRNGNQPPLFPEARNTHSAVHPELKVKHTNHLRELLLVGDRKGAISTAMSAHMWPEAMLIASFTNKEEYKRVLRNYVDDTYAVGDPSRALFMAFADQQEKSVQEPKRLLHTNAQQSTESLVLSAWTSHAQVLLANRTADTNKILTELGDRLWNEANLVTAAHICYLLAGIQVEAPIPTSKIALLGGDHRTPTEARFYVSPGAVQRTEMYEWSQKLSKDAADNVMIPFQGYKLIYAMMLADLGKLEIAFKYVTSMLILIKAVTATTKPGTSMYLEGMKNQLTVLDDRLRQHLGQDRVALVAASTSRESDRKQGKWGLGSALSIMGKIVNRVVEGNDSSAASISNSKAPSGLYASEAISPVTIYPKAPAVTDLNSIPKPSYVSQQTSPPTAQLPSSTVVSNSSIHDTPPTSQTSSVGRYQRSSSASTPTLYSRPDAVSETPSSSNGLQLLQSPDSYPGNRRPIVSSKGNGPQQHGSGFMRSQHSMEPPGSNHSTRSNASFNGMSLVPPSSLPPSPLEYVPSTHEQPLSSQQHSPDSLQSPNALTDPSAKTLSSQVAAKVVTTLSPVEATTMSGPMSDKGKASPKTKKVVRSKTPPPSGSSKGSGWLSGLSSFIVTKMNPEAKVAKLGVQMEAYYDEEAKRWVFPGEASTAEPTKPSAPPTGPMPGSAPGSSATGIPPVGTNSAPSSMRSGPVPSDDPLAALMAPPPSHNLMKKDPLAAMMAPPSRPGYYNARRGSATSYKPPRPQFAVFKPSAASVGAPED
ncbi:hypothetical protein CCR75_008986 [Bremia lactucae]|uniref:Protein transport protein sec16 n=1 Tax=Bremia lactucae TaxID=4779 RepID=A0A976IDR7_BRELC|nr:hypothetical protein CCR75_008986 [Bremia lactucae]